MAITRAQQKTNVKTEVGKLGFFTAGLRHLRMMISPGKLSVEGCRGKFCNRRWCKGRDLDYQMSGGKKGSTFETYRGGKNIGVDNTLAAKYGNKEQRKS
ncbi:MAG: hypothetical protein CM15mV67_440 [uncultured marine virus]|nr:MAG: hypothetical protein CM15mV67_440 [uncultured marine virus]